MSIEIIAKKVGLISGVICMLIGFLLAFVNIFIGVISIVFGYVLFKGARFKNNDEHINYKKSAGLFADKKEVDKNKVAAVKVVSGYSYEDIENEEPEKIKLSDSNIIDKVKFKYKEMDRVVDVYSGKRGESFDGFCHKTGMVLTFYFERINNYEVVRTRTGEVMTPMEWRYQLQGTKIAEQAIEKEKEKIIKDKKIAEENKKVNEKLNDDLNTWLSLTDPKPIVEFEGKIFALGGYFKSGNIEESKEKVTSRGGIIKKDPSAKVDYIVVNAKYGVNVTYEKVIKRLIERGKCPFIISEEHWLEAMK